MCGLMGSRLSRYGVTHRIVSGLRGRRFASRCVGQRHSKLCDHGGKAEIQMQLLMIGGDDPKILRVRLSNGTLDIVASLRSFRPVVDEDTNKWLGVAIDGSTVLTRDI